MKCQIDGCENEEEMPEAKGHIYPSKFIQKVKLAKNGDIISPRYGPRLCTSCSETIYHLFWLESHGWFDGLPEKLIEQQDKIDKERDKYNRLVAELGRNA
jgi:hypothetical protein